MHFVLRLKIRLLSWRQHYTLTPKYKKASQYVATRLHECFYILVFFEARSCCLGASNSYLAASAYILSIPVNFLWIIMKWGNFLLNCFKLNICKVAQVIWVFCCQHCRKVQRSWVRWSTPLISEERSNLKTSKQSSSLTDQQSYPEIWQPQIISIKTIYWGGKVLFFNFILQN